MSVACLPTAVATAGPSAAHPAAATTGASAVPAAVVAPDTAIGVRPGEQWSSDAVSFTYSGTPADAIGSYECRLTRLPFQGPSFVPCPTAGKDFSGLADGSYRFEVRAISTDGTRDPTAAEYLFTVDTVAPETLITAAPDATIRVSTASFAYAGQPANDVAAIECRLVRDGEPAPWFDVCDPAGRTFTDLSDGAYMFEVRARDAAGTPDPTPEARSFRVDTEAPETSIVTGPEGTVGTSSATFSYRAAPAEAGDRFACRMVGPDDPDPAFGPCPSGTVGYTDVADGTYRFEVRASDAVGNVDPTPASRSFTIDTTPPTAAIVSGPEATSTATTAIFAYTASRSEDVDAIECRLVRPDDVAPVFAACPDGAPTYEGLAVGAYRFELRARDAVGNVSAVVAWSFGVEELPVEKPPVTEPPVTEPPVTEPPVTEPPVTEPPGPSGGNPPSTLPAPFVPPARDAGVPLAPPGRPTKLRVSGLRLERTTFRAAKSGATFGPTGAPVRSRGRGTRLRFKLDRAARIELRILRSVKGRWRPLRGTVTRRATRGTVRIPVRGRFGGKALRVGRYRLTIVAVDRATGARTTKNVTFRIRR